MHTKLIFALLTAGVGMLPATGLAADANLMPYEARFGRERPVIAVIAENAGTEMTDYVIPYSILTDSGAAQVLALAIKPGTVTMRPTSLQLVPHATAAQFDAKYPDGADFIVVPAVAKRTDPELIAWISAQGAKGATVVSICDGGLVVAKTGLMDGKKATAHWYTHSMRETEFPQVNWVRNIRYLQDGKVISSSGISAALPTALALVETIAGHQRAASIAARYGISEWGPGHNSDQFVPKFGTNLKGYFATYYANGWFHSTEMVGVPVRNGVDDIALALTMDAYSRTGRSRALAVGNSVEPFTTRNGLAFVPDRVAGAADSPKRSLAMLADMPQPAVFDRVLDGIAADYGQNTADGVSYDFEYPRSQAAVTLREHSGSGRGNRQGQY